jgi:serine/threonine protein kinase
MFLGCGQFEDDGLFIVLEYCDSGTLCKYLNRGDSDKIFRPPWFKRIALLLDVSEGMSYLHLMHNCIHRDLKSANVLLNRERSHGIIRIRAKVADFGLARFENDDARKKHKRMNRWVMKSQFDTHDEKEEEEDEEENITILESKSASTPKTMPTSPSKEVLLTAGHGTPLYMAPEIIEKRHEDIAPYSREVDTYAFGLIMYEALELVAPWSLDFPKNQFTYPIYNAVLNGRRPAVRKKDAMEAPDGFCDLMSRCWAQDRKARPAFNDVYSFLHDISDKMVSNRILLSQTPPGEKNGSTKTKKNKKKKSMTRRLSDTLKEQFLKPVMKMVSGNHDDKDNDNNFVELHPPSRDPPFDTSDKDVVMSTLPSNSSSNRDVVLDI